MEWNGEPCSKTPGHLVDCFNGFEITLLRQTQNVIKGWCLRGQLGAGLATAS